MIKSCQKCKGEGFVVISIEEDRYRGYIKNVENCSHCNSYGYVDTRQNLKRGRAYRIFHKSRKLK